MTALTFFKRTMRLCRFAIYVLSTLLAADTTARAQWNYKPEPSFDTTPTLVKVDRVTYKIPRNYLIFVDRIPTLRVAWPGLRPLTQKTKICFGVLRDARAAGCEPLEIHLLGSRGPGPGNRALTAAEMFENFLARNSGAVKTAGPAGFDVYSIGPARARIEHYRKAEGDIYFFCMLQEVADRPAICSDNFRLRDNNHAQFHFNSALVPNVQDIEAQIRNLMANFVAEEKEIDVN
jgi:hypothetical protein